MEIADKCKQFKFIKMEKINILWTTTNRDTITNMILMYSTSTRQHGLWDEVNVIIWGGSAKLIGENVDVQAEVSEMIEKGVHVEACQACAEKYGAVETLRNLGVDVKFMGKPLTDYIKNGEKILTL